MAEAHADIGRYEEQDKVDVVLASDADQKEINDGKLVHQESE